ncbi:MAG TPA: MFS transporter, partial [Nostoc sp.]|uniref:MFS transporter n=1 Tax=Nostoc sp. TaxID=1180 RepID=UPI002D73E7F4
RKSSTFYVILIAGAAALGGFLFGFDTAVINGAVGAIATAFNANSVEIGLAVSLALLGSAVGAFYAGKIADRYGRVKAMVASSVLFTISVLDRNSSSHNIYVSLDDSRISPLLGCSRTRTRSC